MNAQQLIGSSLVWDAHCCAPLHPDYPLTHLKRHLDAGIDFVSINIGMDMNPVSQIMQVIASFRAQIKAHPELFVQALTMGDVDRARESGRLAVAFDLEGGVPLMGRPEMVWVLKELGVRQIHLAYNRNNELACGCYDEDGPLTDLGREIVKAIFEAGILMDCSHTGHRCSLDIMAMGLGPVIFSHANPRSVKADLRNVTEEQIKACVATDGVICVNGVGRFLSDPEAGSASLVEAIDALVNAAGVRHVGIGIDYEYDSLGLQQLPPTTDRGYWWPREHGYGAGGVTGIRIARPEQLVEITAGILALGYSDEDVALILGGNMRRVAAQLWPG